MIKIKTEREIELIRKASRIVAEIISRLKQNIRPGTTTKELDTLAVGLFKELGAHPAFKGYRGYPANICTSVNEEVVHGIPGKRRLREGDIISLDVGAELNGYFSDAACTVAVGSVTPAASRLLKVTEEALTVGVAKARAGNHLFDISSAIQSFAESFGYSVVRKFVGHGIGSQMHEEPEIPNFGTPGSGPLLKTGMVLAIEPMVNEGNYEVVVLNNDWTAITKDKKLSAHFEHTICITEGVAEILTAQE